MLGTAWWKYVLKVVAASLVMLVVLLLIRQTPEQWLAWSDFVRAGVLTLVCTAGGLGYVLALLALGVRPSQFHA